MKPKKAEKTQPIPTLDLRPITRSTDFCSLEVRLHWDWDLNFVWIRAGQASLRLDHSRFKYLHAYLPVGVTDFEHDSAYAFRLPLVGIELKDLSYHQTEIQAYIDANNPEDFHIPPPDYNPMKHPKSFTCKDKGCEKHHIIVPEGFYCPPRDPELFEKVKGKRVEILFSPVYPKEDG